MAPVNRNIQQSNDVGRQYRCATNYPYEEQRDLIERIRYTYSKVISDRGNPAITTRITLASEHTYFMAEDYHQQYLYKLPNGYRCNVTTKLALPELSWPR